MKKKFPYNFAIKGDSNWIQARRINAIFVSLGIEPEPHPYNKYTASGLYYYIGDDNNVHSGERYDKEIMERIVLSMPLEYHKLRNRNLI